jgi:hypothetical protein
MLDRDSSGNWANVAEVYHGSGTRSQSVSGLAEWWPSGPLAPCLLVWAAPQMRRVWHGPTKQCASFAMGAEGTYATQKYCRIATRHFVSLLTESRRRSDCDRRRKLRATSGSPWRGLVCIRSLKALSRRLAVGSDNSEGASGRRRVIDLLSCLRGGKFRKLAEYPRSFHEAWTRPCALSAVKPSISTATRIVPLLGRRRLHPRVTVYCPLEVDC